MRPINHAIATAAIGIPVLIGTRSPALAACFAVPCLLIDVDHLLDFVIWEKKPLNFKRFFKEGVPRTWPRMLYILHGYEWVALLGVAAWRTGSPELTAVALGWFSHIILDDVGNRFSSNPTRIKLPFYFVLFRLSRGFKRERVSRFRESTVQR